MEIDYSMGAGARKKAGGEKGKRRRHTRPERFKLKL
jgi:hypothetical protein